MDLNVLVLLMVFSLVPTILGLMGRKPGWAMIILFGAMIAAIGAVALYSDGNLTYNGTTIAAANGNFVSDFNAVSVIPVTIALSELVIAIRRIFNM